MNWLHHPLIHDLGLTLLHFLWQGLLIGVLYAGARLWFRNAPASLRYALAVLTLGVLALTPPATLAWLALQAPVPDASAASAAGAGTLTLETVLIHSAPLAGIAPWVVGAWLVGVLVLSMRLVAGWHFLATLRRSADRAAARHLRPRLESLAERMGIRRRVHVACSNRVDSPILLGWLRPVILLPASVISGFPTRQLEMVLVHELAHVRRHDHLVNLFQTVVETLLFYHPVVAWVSRDVRLERENACDDLAVHTAGDRVGYVEMLAALENLRHSHFRLAMAVNDGQVLSRIRRLLTPQGRRGFGMIGPLLAIVTTVAGITGISWLPLDGEESSASRDATARTPEPLAAEPFPVEGPRPAQVEPLELPAAEPDNAPQSAAGGAGRRGRPDHADHDSSASAASAPGTDQTRSTAATDTGTAPEPAPQADDRSPPPADGTAAAQSMNRDAAQRSPNREAASATAQPPDPSPEQAPAESADQTAEPIVETISEPIADLTGESRRALAAAVDTARGPLPTAPESMPGGGGDNELPVTGGEIVERISPDYPERAERLLASGVVQVEFTVDSDGSVDDIRIIDERPRHLSFGRAAREAIARWQFEPFRRGDQTVAQRIRMELKFDPDDAGCRPRTGTRISRC